MLCYVMVMYVPGFLQNRCQGVRLFVEGGIVLQVITEEYEMQVAEGRLFEVLGYAATSVRDLWVLDKSYLYDHKV